MIVLAPEMLEFGEETIVVMAGAAEVVVGDERAELPAGTRERQTVS